MLTFAYIFYFAFMEFRIKTLIPTPKWHIHHADKLMIMGSCFAEHIGKRLHQTKFRCDLNPFGVLYNPLSIAEALQQLIAQYMYTESELIEFPDGGWSTWLHHSRFSQLDRATALSRINDRISCASRTLKETDALIITWGTSWVYKLASTNMIVGNCHKQPDSFFIRERLTVSQITETYTELLEALWQQRPELKVIFTVSPVRHLKDGLHENQLSKATLLIATEELCNKYPERCYYFPAYEIVIDELRDYRFYAEDMAHPSEQAVEYVWQCFTDTCIDKQAQAFIAEWEKIRKALDHRPFQPKSQKYQDFVRQNLLKIVSLKEKYPYLEAQNEIDLCHTLLKTSQP